MKAQLSLVVPLFNEEQRVTESAPALADFVGAHGAGSELIFVDDGSADATARVVDGIVRSRPDVRIRLLRRPHLGKGAAVQAGLSAAECEYAAFCDVDLSTPLDQLEEVIVAAQLSDALILASRDVTAARLVRHQGATRELLGKLFNRAVQVALVPGISDTQCGAKAAARSVWEKILPYCTETGFAWDVEAVTVARRLGLPVQEVGVEWSHDDRSRVRVGRDGAAMVVALARIWRRSRRLSPPRAAPASGVFDAAQSETLLEADSDHWWFRSKAALVASAIRRHRDRVRPGAMLCDIGAGAGGVTAQLGWPPEELVAVEGSDELLATARHRHALLGVRAVGERLPFRDRGAGVVTMLDVIEHLEDPVVTLREVRRALEPDGLLVVTVPAHEWLWSAGDELLGHVRRYTRATLRRDLQRAGFAAVDMSHIFSWLVLPVWIHRRATSDAEQQLGLSQTSALIDRAALVLTRIEASVVRGVSLPFGTSILAVATIAEDAR